jgi:hypothetical protein
MRLGNEWVVRTCRDDIRLSRLTFLDDREATRSMQQLRTLFRIPETPAFSEGS